MSNKVVNDDLLDAFLDDELHDQDIDQLLDALDCENARSRACRQGIAGRALAGDASLCVDISCAVRAAVARENTQASNVVDFAGVQRERTAHAAKFGRGQSWRVPATGLALAASAALAALIVVKPAQQPDTGMAELAQAEQLPETSQVASHSQPQPDLLAKVRQQALQSAPQKLPLAPVQRVAAGNFSAASGARELTIAAPQQQRPVHAQWALVGQSGQDQNLAAQQRLQQQLNTMLINHARFGGSSALPGSLGYARVTAHTSPATQK